MNVAGSLLAIGFVHTALLGGMGLLALPILIHLLSRRRHRLVAWGATQFLLEAEKESRRRVRFEQWLLVALRSLAMLLLALVIARPFVEPGLIAKLLGGRGEVHRVIVIDDSASLGYRGAGIGGGDDFDRTRETVDRLLGWIHDGAPGDPVTIYITSRPDEPLIADTRLNVTNLADVRGRVESLRASVVPAQPRRYFAQLAGRLASLGRQAQADIYVVSDFQRSEWIARDAASTVFAPLVGDVANAANAQDAPDASGAVNGAEDATLPDLRVILIGIADGAAGGLAATRDNIALVDVRPQHAQSIAGLPTLLHAEIANYSREPLEDAQLEITLDDQTLPAVSVERLEPGQTQPVTFEATFADPGFAQVSVSAGPRDGYPLDDACRTVIPIRGALSVLVVNGQPAVEDFADEVYFLRNALAPPGPFSSGIRLSVIDADELETTFVADAGRLPGADGSQDDGRVPPPQYDCVLLCNVAPPSESVCVALRQFVERGGGLAFFLGENIGSADEYNHAFGPAGVDLLPLPLEEIVRHTPPNLGAGMQAVVEHPLTTMFAGGAGLSELVHFRAYYGCVAPDEATARTNPSPADADGGPAASEVDAASATPEVLTRYTDESGTPALITRARGKGRIVLFTSTADTGWNDWPRAVDGSYVVTLLELVHYLGRSGAAQRAYHAGQPLVVDVPVDRYEPRATLHFPQGAEVPAQELRGEAVDGPAGAVLRFAGPIARQVGVYTLELLRTDGEIEPRPLCVNADPVESNLLTADPSDLSRALAGVEHEVLRASDAFGAATSEARRELWPGLLVLLMLVLLFEQYLAWWFGSGGGLHR